MRLGMESRGKSRAFLAGSTAGLERGRSMSFESRRLNAVRAGVRAALRRVLSQEKRTELKRLQSLASKRLSPLLTLAYGTFDTNDLRAELARRLPSDFEILMVHSSYDGLLPMYKGSAGELLAVLIEFAGLNAHL